MTLMDPVRLNKAALRRPELRLGSIARHLPALLRQGAHCSFCSLLEDLSMNPRTEINPRQCRAMNLRRRACLQVLATLGCAVFAYPAEPKFPDRFRAAAGPRSLAARASRRGCQRSDVGPGSADGDAAAGTARYCACKRGACLRSRHADTAGPAKHETFLTVPACRCGGMGVLLHCHRVGAGARLCRAGRRRAARRELEGGHGARRQRASAGRQRRAAAGRALPRQRSHGRARGGRRQALPHRL